MGSVTVILGSQWGKLILPNNGSRNRSDSRTGDEGVRERSSPTLDSTSYFLIVYHTDNCLRNAEGQVDRPSSLNKLIRCMCTRTRWTQCWAYGEVRKAT
jgi:hypothetical protein